MANQIEETEDGGVAVDLSVKPTRKFKGTDANPLDADTGETVFEDLSPRFNERLEEAAEAAEAAAKPDADEDDEEEVKLEDEEPAEELTAEEADVDDVDDVDEIKPKSKDAFTKRLERQQRLVDETRAESAALRARLDKQEAAAKAQADESKYVADKVKLESDLKLVRSELVKAIEEGNTTAQVEANEKLTDIKGDLKVLDVRHVDAKLAVENSRSARTDSDIVRTKSTAWVRQHNRYNTDKEFAATARTVDQQVAAAGFDPETDGYYRELNKRMAKFYPKEFKAAAKENEQVPVRRKHPASGLRREDGARTTTNKSTGPFSIKNGRAILTARHVQTMRNFGLDPTNANDVKDFVEQNRS